jgi:phosphoglycerate dehydrogenase-like enzyme
VKLFVTDVVARQFGDQIRQAAPAAELVTLNADSTWSGDPTAAEAGYISVDSLISRSFGRLVEDLPQMQKLRWVHTFSIGVDDPAYRQIVDRGITMTNGAGTQSIPISQYVLLMMLHHVKGMANWERQQARREWSRSPSDELTGKTVALFGIGGIGSEVARLAKALRMRVVGLRRTPGPVEYVDEVLPPEKLGELCAQADFLVICAPLTTATKGAIGAPELARMKPTAYLINVARGPIVQEAAMVETLRAGRIAGAALDVFDQEPLPADHELWGLPNVTITPHTSPASPMHIVRGTEMFVENLALYAAGRPLRNIVDAADVGAGLPLTP